MKSQPVLHRPLTSALLMAALLSLFVGRPAWAQTTPSDQPYISEVSPAADANQPAWVELTVGRVEAAAPPASVIYLPVVQGAEAGAAAAALAQTASLLSGAVLAGWRIGDEDGNDYTIPANLGDLPLGTRVVIHFDGQGAAADDRDAGDGSVYLHTPTGLIDIFDPAGDQLALLDDTRRTGRFRGLGARPC